MSLLQKKFSGAPPGGGEIIDVILFCLKKRGFRPIISSACVITGRIRGVII